MHLGQTERSVQVVGEDCVPQGIRVAVPERDRQAASRSDSSSKPLDGLPRSAGLLPRGHTTAAYDLTADDATFAGLLNALTELVDSGDISHDGLIRSLEAKLDAGSAAQGRGNVSAAIGSLGAFRNELAAKRETLSTAAFERLDGLATRLLAVL